MEIKSKKGIFFTIGAIMLLGFLLYSLTYGKEVSEQNKARILEIRAGNTHNHLENIEGEIEKILQFSLAKSLRTSLVEIQNTFAPLTDAEAILAELMMNGSLLNVQKPSMNGNTIDSLIANLNTTYSQIGINFNYQILSLNVSQNSPWEIQADLSMNYTVLDEDNIVHWTRLEVLNTTLSLIGWEDPLFIIKTNNTFERIIQKKDVLYFINASDGNTTYLLQHIAEERYVDSQQAPSYMLRLEGSDAAHTWGIESLVNVTALAMEFRKENLSSVDYLYFSSTIQTYSNWSLNGTPALPEDFRLDNNTGPAGKNHTDFYNATGNLIA